MNNVQQIHKNSDVQEVDTEDWELEKTLFHVHAQRLAHLDSISEKELELLDEGNEKVMMLHDIIGRINAITGEDGKVSIQNDSELSKLLLDAEKMGVKLSKTHGDFSDKERERVFENINHFIEDLNTANQMRMQQVTRITNERYETYTMTKTCQKVLDEDKKNKARAIKGG